MSENIKNYPRDILLIISTLLAAINLWQPPTPCLRQGKIYVSPQGSDWNLGNSPQRAVKTIQLAANMATPGEDVVILPGIYREDLRVRRGGRPNRPITFRAQQPGTVTITNAVPPQVTQYLTWRSHGNGLYSTIFTAYKFSNTLLKPNARTKLMVS